MEIEARNQERGSAAKKGQTLVLFDDNDDGRAIAGRRGMMPDKLRLGLCEAHERAYLTGICL